MDETKPQGNTRNDKISSFNQKQAVKSKDTTTLIPKPTQEQKKELDKEEIIKNKAAQTADVRKEEQQAQQEQKKQEEEEARKTSDTLKQAGQIASTVQETVDDKIDPLKKFFAQVPTPGGIASMLLLLGFFLLAVLPVNQKGDTRLKLLWLTLTGKTHLAYTGTNSTNTPALQDLQHIENIVSGHGGKGESTNGTFVPDTTGFEQIDIMSFLFDN